MRSDNLPTPVWRLITHHAYPEEALKWSRRNSRVAIGWGRVGDLRSPALSSTERIADAIERAYPGIGNAGSGGVCLHAFHSEVAIGDLVILSTSSRREVVMEITGDYEFNPSPEAHPIGDYQHQRRAFALPINANVLWTCAGSKTADGYSIRWTLIRCRKDLDPETKAELLE